MPRKEEKMRTNDLRIGLAVALTTLALPAVVGAQMKPLALEMRGGLGWAVSDLRNGIGDEVVIGRPGVAAAERGWSGSADLY